MEIEFRFGKMEDLCNCENAMKKELGSKMAEKLQDRLTLLENTPTLSGVPKGAPTYCHELQLNRHGQFAVNLKDQYKLVFLPANDPIPLKLDGGIDLTRVTKIEILEIVDYH